ncbi:MAG TPA: ANTAR domain-containing protein [Sphingomicrobium sp.]|nr:ANTAR domain-containing protein [Sphingomicrobium sp.]
MRIAIVDESDLRAAVVEEGLRDAGLVDIVRVPPRGAFVAQLEELSPDVVIFDLGSPTRDTLEEMLVVSRALARPIAMFVDQSDEQMTEAAIDAGVSAYVVDGLKKERVKSILDLAVRRFNAFASLQRELLEARTALAERRIIDKAKLYLMSNRKLVEADAYALLRGTAMRQGKRIAEIAQALLTAAEILEGKQKDPE